MDVDFDPIIEGLPVTGDYGTDMACARGFMNDNMFTPDPTKWICLQSDAEIVINGKLKEHFNLKVRDCNTLLTYFKEYAPKPRKEPKQKSKRETLRAEILNDLTERKSTSSDEIDPLDIDYDEKGISEERQITAKEKALNIMKTGDPLETILKNVEKDHTGDTKFQELFCVAVASQSCVNTAGIHPSMHGAAGSGKSHAVKTHAHRIRAKHKLESTLSAKAAYYNRIKPGYIVISDDTEPNEAMEETIKRSTTNFQEKTIHTTVHDGEGAYHIIPERIIWIFTSVNNNGSDQLSDRQVKCNTNETKEQKNKAVQKQLEESNAGKYGLTDVDDDILVCRYIYDEIKSKTFRVRIPFADRITFHITDNLRNTQRFLDMIKGFSVIYHMQRETDENGCLLANEWDFELAQELFNSQLESAVTQLTEKERRIIKYIGDHSPCTAAQVSKGVGYSYKVTRETIHGKPNQISGGLLDKVKGLIVSRETHTEKMDDENSISKTADYYSIKNPEMCWELFDNKFVDLVYK